MSIKDAQDINTDPAKLLMDRLDGRRRILFYGDMGTGKSTLAVALARLLSWRFECCQLLSLDPGTPPFGVPGTVCRGWWRHCDSKWDHFKRDDCQPLCTLDAARFRLPLILAARRLMRIAEREGGCDLLVIDPPGVVRGAGGAEMLIALVELLHVDAVVVLFQKNEPLPLSQELASLRAKVLYEQAAPEAKRLSTMQRIEYRTRLWDDFLADSEQETVSLDRLHLLGTPPPLEVPEAWAGRQVALLDAEGKCARLGEIVGLADGKLSMRSPPGLPPEACNALLIRDAGRTARGLLETIRPIGKTADRLRAPEEMTALPIPPDALTAPVSTRVGAAWATLVNGVFGDPLVHVRLRNLKQSILFDLGDPARLAAKVIHQVNTVLLSHAHIDHIGGFLWLLRSRIGPFGPCRIFGPLETISRIESYIEAVTWDRIEDNAPIFDVYEIDGPRLKGARLQPGRPKVRLPDLPVPAGIILTEKNYHVKAVVCDHNIPSVAYALIFSRGISVRKDKLKSSGLSPGPWLGRLKQCIAQDMLETRIALPGGARKKVNALARELTTTHPGQKLVYAADMADSAPNRKKIIDLAESAHTLFCEAAFMAADKTKADPTQHLTTRAAVEIARAAGVKQLVPFHFSKRYEKNSRMVFEEIKAAAGPVRILGHF